MLTAGTILCCKGLRTCNPTIPPLGRMRDEVHPEFEASLGLHSERPSLSLGRFPGMNYNVDIISEVKSQRLQQSKQVKILPWNAEQLGTIPGTAWKIARTDSSSTGTSLGFRPIPAHSASQVTVRTELSHA